MRVCACVCLRVCMCACVYVCLCVWILLFELCVHKGSSWYAYLELYIGTLQRTGELRLERRVLCTQAPDQFFCRTCHFVSSSSLILTPRVASWVELTHTRHHVVTRIMANTHENTQMRAYMAATCLVSLRNSLLYLQV